MKRYYSFKDYLAKTFPGKRVYKITIDAGFTCPNRDGKISTGGCIYCDNRSFSPTTRMPKQLSIAEQVKNGIEFYRTRQKADKFIVYFQAFSNTYGSPDKLKELYDQALTFPDIVGLAIGTRPDCVSEEIIDLIAGYTKNPARMGSGGLDVWIEYGLQSAHNKTLELINRGHTYEDFVKAVEMTKGKGIKIASHIILGLPGETRNDMIVTAQKVGLLGIDGIKIHHLYVAKDTQLEKLHNESTIKIMKLEEYVPLVCDIIENLPENMIIQRLVGELSEQYSLAPRWGASKAKIIALIEQELEERGTVQGRLFPKCGECITK
jgi:radical SAM protein (TIGR01212 family)